MLSQKQTTCIHPIIWCFITNDTYIFYRKTLVHFLPFLLITRNYHPTMTWQLLGQGMVLRLQQADAQDLGRRYASQREEKNGCLDHFLNQAVMLENIFRLIIRDVQILLVKRPDITVHLSRITIIRKYYNITNYIPMCIQHLSRRSY